MANDKASDTNGADKFSDRVSGLAGQARDKAGELAEKAAPYAEKASGMAASGVDAAASGLDKVTGGRFSGQIKSVSGKLSHLFDREHSHEEPKDSPPPPPSGTDTP